MDSTPLAAALAMGAGSPSATAATSAAPPVATTTQSSGTTPRRTVLVAERGCSSCGWPASRPAAGFEQCPASDCPAPLLRPDLAARRRSKLSVVQNVPSEQQRRVQAFEQQQGLLPTPQPGGIDPRNAHFYTPISPDVQRLMMLGNEPSVPTPQPEAKGLPEWVMPVAAVGAAVRHRDGDGPMRQNPVGTARPRRVLAPVLQQLTETLSKLQVASATLPKP